MITSENYFENTRADFKPIPEALAKDLLTAYYEWRRKRNRPKYIEAQGKKYRLDHLSERKNAFWRSRSFSVYFIQKGGRSIIRISDHWSSSKHDRSRKLNCGYIRSCYWSMDK